MQLETKKCQNCKVDFIIEPDDFSFYEKINVPAPTFCPTCRLQRRMIFQNERTFYKRKCDLCDEESIMTLPADSDYTVYCTKCWWSDKWDPKDYAQDYDFDRPFFEQFQELSKKVPVLGVNTIISTLENSPYCNISSHLKNCYLLFNSDYDEDCRYSAYLERSKMCSDLYMCDLCERCYMSTNLFKCTNVYYSNSCNESSDLWFCRNVIGCMNCFGCINLRNKQYCIFNEQYTKEEYEQKIADMQLHIRDNILHQQKKTKEFHKKFPKRYMEGLKCEDVSGDYVFTSKNVYHSYEVVTAKDCKYCQFLIIDGIEDSYDYTMWGMNAVRMYECMGAGQNSSDIKFTFESWSASNDLEYCWNIFTSSSNLFGSIALKSAQYCILNKQYTKEQYEELLPKIKQHMMDMPFTDSKGHIYKYGEFFPEDLSYYTYNESIVQKYFPITKETAEERNIRWKEGEDRKYDVTVKVSDLSQDIEQVDNAICSEIIECAHSGSDCNQQCSSAFRITHDEFEFYKALNVPLPDLCSNCRHYEIIAYKNDPIHLYDRQCMCDREGHSHSGACQNTFKTSYSTDSTELIYCEECYQKEID